jgi:hypothetical protein
VGGVTIDDVQDAIDNYVPVTGGVGQVIGIPPGTPFVYVPANLAANPADLNAIGFAEYSLASPSSGALAQERGVFSQDTSNVLGIGTETVINSDGSNLYAYNPSSGITASLSFSSLNISKNTFTANSSIVVGRGATTGGTTANARVYDGSTWSSVTLTNPSTGLYWGMGPCTTPSRICSVFASASGTGTTLVRVAEYSTAGGANLANNTFTLTTSVTSAQVTAKVENGWAILLTGTGRFFVGPANATSTNTWREFQVLNAGLTIGENSITIGASGIGFGSYRASSSNGLFRFDANTGVLTLYAGALDGVVTSQTVAFSTIGRQVVSWGMSYANDNAATLGGMYQDPSTSAVSPVYLSFDTTGGSVSISAVDFGPTGSTALSSGRVYSPVVLASGNVTFVALNTTSPGYRLLYQVAGP